MAESLSSCICAPVATLVYIVLDTVITIKNGRTLEYLKLEEIPWVICGIDLSQGSHGLFMGLN